MIKVKESILLYLKPYYKKPGSANAFLNPVEFISTQWNFKKTMSTGGLQDGWIWAVQLQRNFTLLGKQFLFGKMVVHQMWITLLWYLILHKIYCNIYNAISFNTPDVSVIDL